MCLCLSGKGKKKKNDTLTASKSTDGTIHRIDIDSKIFLLYIVQKSIGVTKCQYDHYNTQATPKAAAATATNNNE